MRSRKLSARVGLPERHAALRHLQKASATFDAADAVHTEARNRLLERLHLFDISPLRVIDLGSATGKGAWELRKLYPRAAVTAVDLSPPMAERARCRCENLAGVAAIVGDAEQLPFREDSADLVFANLLLPWCDPAAVFAEVARVLDEGGLALFTSLGPDTLQEVRRAWSRIDTNVHVHGFVDMHDLGDLAGRAGLAEPVMDVDRLRVTYSSVERLVADLRACGATNVARGRRTQLTGPGRWRTFCQEMEAGCVEGTLAISVELIFGQAWGRGGDPSAGAVGIAVEDLVRNLRERGPRGS